MGTDFSAVLLDNKNPEHRLWKAVLVNAIEDTFVMNNDRKSSIYKVEAYEWLLKDSDDFDKVCYWGGFEPDMVNWKYRIAVDRGDICFTERQIAWGKYYKQYKRLKECKDHGSRVYHRKHMEHLKSMVHRAPVTLVSMVTLSRIA